MNDIVSLRLRETTAADAGRKTIPFDYSLRLPNVDARDRDARPARLERGVKLSGLVQISIEAPFVATSIGYGFVLPVDDVEFGVPEPPARTPRLPDLALAAQPRLDMLKGALAAQPRPDVLESALDALDRRLAATSVRGGITLQSVLTNGFRINPKYAVQLQPRPGADRGFDLRVLGDRPPADLFQAVRPRPEQLSFLYSIHDEGTGRSFQSEPVLSTAGLGGPDGKRPFRHFATPVQFAPRTTIRIDVVPLQTVAGELYISLHGYKVLGGPGTPTDLARVARRLRRRARS